MKLTPYPHITNNEYYILAFLCGLFVLYTPIYACVAYALLCYYAYQTHRIHILYLCIATLFGCALFWYIYRDIPPPPWYSSGSTYSIEGIVDSVKYSTHNKVDVVIRDITIRERVYIQSISKKKECQVYHGGRIIYRKARTCAVGYPSISDKSLPRYAIYTMRRDIPSIAPRQKIRGVFTIEDIHANDNGEFSLQEYYAKQHIQYRLRLREPSTRMIYGTPSIASRISTFAKHRFSSAMEYVYGETQYKDTSKLTNEAIAIAYALLLGTRSALPNEVEKLLLSSGLLHSVVLSGLHVSSLILFAFPCMLLYIRLIPYSIYSIPVRIITLFFLICFALLYAIMSAFPLSYIRATCMLCITFIFMIRYQRYTLLDIILYTIAVLALCTPESLFTISLQLSCGAVFAIYFSLPITHSYLTRLRNIPLPSFVHHIASALGSIIITTLAINLTLFPLLASSFGSLPYNIFLNLLWLPLLTFVVLPLLLIAFLLSLCGYILPFLWYCALTPIELLLSLLYTLRDHGWLHSMIQMRPHTLTTIAFYLALFTYMLYANGRTHKRMLYILCLCSLSFLSIPIFLRIYQNYEEAIVIDILDVGKGQAIVLRYKQTRMLVDAGGRTPYFDAGERILSPVLTRNAFPTLTSVLLTHQDSDHIGGAVFLAQHYTIDNFYYNGDTTKETQTITELFAKTKTMKAVYEGDSISLGNDVVLNILLPRRDIHREVSAPERSNEKSIVAMLVYQGKNRALLLGDIDIAGQKYLVERYGTALQCELIVLAHHGSRHNMYPPLYSATQARYAVASTGSIDSNFIAPIVRKAIAKHGMKLYTTYTHGRIQYIRRPTSTTISYEKTYP